MEVDKKRIDALAKHRIGWSVAEICRSEDISRMTFYHWLHAFQASGNSGLVKKSTRPKTLHTTLTPSLVQEVLRLRQGTQANEYAIQAWLLGRGIRLSHTTIYKILKAHRLVRPPAERKQRTYGQLTDFC